MSIPTSLRSDTGVMGHMEDGGTWAMGHMGDGNMGIHSLILQRSSPKLKSI